MINRIKEMIERFLEYDYEQGIVLAWPGQGGPNITEGMGKEICDKNPIAKSLMDRTDEWLKKKPLSEQLPGGYTLSQHCWDNPMGLLQKDTRISQLAAYTVGVIYLIDYTGIKKWNPDKIFKFPRGKMPSAVAGMSVGLYPASYAGGMYNYYDGLDLVHSRSVFMHREGEKPENKGKVLVVRIKPEDYGKIKDLCKKGTAKITNRNAPDQVIIGGSNEDVDAFVVAAEKENLFSAKKDLPIGVVVHHPFMKEAAKDFGWVIEGQLVRWKLNNPRVPIIIDSSEDELSFEMTMAYEAMILFPQQIDNPVFWTNVMNRVNAKGDVLLELGQGQTITNLKKKAKSVERLTLWRALILRVKDKKRKGHITLNGTFFIMASVLGWKNRIRTRH